MKIRWEFGVLLALVLGFNVFVHMVTGQSTGLHTSWTPTNSALMVNVYTPGIRSCTFIRQPGGPAYSLQFGIPCGEELNVVLPTTNADQNYHPVGKIIEVRTESGEVLYSAFIQAPNIMIFPLVVK